MVLGCSGGVRTSDVQYNKNNEEEQCLKTWNTWIKRSELIIGLQEQGYIHMSPVQGQAMPFATTGIDLIVEAKSGTGKTLVFSVPALESIDILGSCQILILAPTREIAVQIAEVIQSLGKHINGMNVGVFIGGTNIQTEISQIRSKNYHIIVGSPGRLKHLIKDNILNIQTVRMFVLDEADKLLEESFIKDINFIYKRLPEHKQVIATSATYTEALKDLLLRYMKMPACIKPHSSAVLLGISQYIATTDSHPLPAKQNDIKLKKLINILSKETFKQCLVFCNYQIRARVVCKNLELNGWPVSCLCSSQTQSDRLESLQKLQKFNCRILVATDLAARGLDAHNVDLVINLEFPQDMATYLHRIGRCGRYGSLGKGITIVSGDEKDKFRSLLSSINSECNISDWDPSNKSENYLKSQDLTRQMTSEWTNFESLLESLKKCDEKRDFSLILKSFKEATSDESIERVQFGDKNCDLLSFLNNIVEVRQPEIEEHNIKLVDTINEESLPTPKTKKKKSDKQRKENRPQKVKKMRYIHMHENDDYEKWRMELQGQTQQIYYYVYMFTMLNFQNNN